MDEILLRQRLQNPLRKKTTFSQQMETTLTALIIILAVMIAILSGVLLFINSDQSQKGYLLKHSQVENTQLKEDQESLNRKIIDISSVDKLQENPALKNMSQPTEKTFVQRKN